METTVDKISEDSFPITQRLKSLIEDVEAIEAAACVAEELAKKLNEVRKEAAVNSARVAKLNAEHKELIFRFWATRSERDFNGWLAAAGWTAFMLVTVYSVLSSV